MKFGVKMPGADIYCVRDVRLSLHNRFVEEEEVREMRKIYIHSREKCIYTCYRYTQSLRALCLIIRQFHGGIFQGEVFFFFTGKEEKRARESTCQLCCGCRNAWATG